MLQVLIQKCGGNIYSFFAELFCISTCDCSVLIIHTYDDVEDVYQKLDEMRNVFFWDIFIDSVSYILTASKVNYNFQEPAFIFSRFSSV